MRYLLVEDNLELAEAVLARLALDGHAVDHAATLAEAEDCLAAASYDLILLDVMLPDGDGREFLARSRARLEVPVIVLTARSQVTDRVGALDQGLTTISAKPYRISPSSRRGSRSGAPPGRRVCAQRDRARAAVIRSAGGTLRLGQQVVDLRARIFVFSEVFARHTRARSLSKGQLMDRLYRPTNDAEVNGKRDRGVMSGRLRRRIDGNGIQDREPCAASATDGARRA